VISTLGICDLRENVPQRWEFELNQVNALGEGRFPAVEIVDVDDVLDCDVFLFCASRFVPDTAVKSGDVRMAQYELNRPLAASYARMAGERGFRGMFCVVSDPVDPLCRAALLEGGLSAGQIRGFWLGVMDARARYYAARDARFAAYLTEGRAFGPHGEGLVLANSIDRYDDALSRELTEKVKRANLDMRALGFKPYAAPALSSGALSLLACLRGGRGDGVPAPPHGPLFLRTRQRAKHPLRPSFIALATEALTQSGVQEPPAMRVRLKVKQRNTQSGKMVSVQATKKTEGMFLMANSLAHTKWVCKYHIVFTPKYRRKIIYHQLRKDIQQIIKDLCKWKGVEIIEGHMMPDHVHLLVSIPPKYSVSQFMGYLKGKSAMMIFERHANLKYKFGNRNFWATGYYVSTVGLNTATIQKYIREQEKQDQIEDSLSKKEYSDPFKGSK